MNEKQNGTQQDVLMSNTTSSYRYTDVFASLVSFNYSLILNVMAGTTIRAVWWR